MMNEMDHLLEALQGEWKVTALGPAAILNALGDRKQIVGDGGRNMLRPGILISDYWGFFSIHVKEGMVRDYVVLDYDDSRNHEVLRKVHDRIVQSGDGWSGGLFFQGVRIFDFRLDR